MVALSQSGGELLDLLHLLLRLRGSIVRYRDVFLLELCTHLPLIIVGLFAHFC